MPLRSRFVSILTCLTFLLMGFPSSLMAQSQQLKLGIMGDSSSDEYRADDNRAGGTQWANTTLSWNELLQKYRGVYLGPWGNRAEPRRSGYENNWARSNAIVSTLISSGQHTGIANLVSQDKVDVVYIQIGNNDFALYNSGYDGYKIYHGQLTGTQLTSKINTLVSNIQTAVNTVLAADNQVQIILGNIPDPGMAPTWQMQYPDPVKRQRLSNAINQANQGIAGIANNNSRVSLFDIAGFGNTLIGRVNASGNLVISGYNVSLLTTGNAPSNAILADGIHGGTVLEALQANAIIEKINQVGSYNIPQFSDAEIVYYAGLSQTQPVTPSPVPTSTPPPTPNPTPTPTATPQFNIADINKDGVVDLADYSILAVQFLKTGTALSADLNHDQLVDLADYSILALNFLK